MASVSVTELNQQTANVLLRVKNGESLEVKEHGRVVARLIPVLANAPLIERLVSEGRAIAAASTDALFDAVAPASAVGPSLSDALRHARDAERF